MVGLIGKRLLMRAHDVPDFLLNQVPGAFEPGTPVRKINSEPDDVHPDGQLGEVLSSIEHDGVIGYFVEFAPGTVTFIVDSKLEVPFEAAP